MTVRRNDSQAHRLADGLDVDRPAEALAGCGITLHVSSDPLRARGITIRGSWDPTLRRIDLYDAGGSRPEQLLHSLLHEIWHACADDPSRGNEVAAEAFAAGVLRTWDPHRIARCGTALNGLARDHARSFENTHPDRSYLGIGP